MIGHVEAVRMHNIQSWGEQGNVMTFDFEKVNVIIARNETGKSVLFKVFRQMCFPSFFGRTGRKDLIKLNCEFGRLDILTSEGYLVGFEMYAKSQVYYLTDPDGKETKWVQDELPEPIRKVLGWYIDVEHRILLNIIDHEIAMPLVETESSFNAKVLRFVVEHQGLEDAIIRQRGWVDSLTEMIDIEQRVITQLSNRIHMIPYQDISPLEEKHKLLELYTKAITGTNRIAVAVTNYNKELLEPKMLNALTGDESNQLDNIVKGLEQLDDLTQELTNRNNLSKPIFESIDEEQFELLRKTDNQLYELYDSTVQSYNHALTAPKEVVVHSSIEPIMNVRGYVYRLADALDELNINRIKMTEAGSNLNSITKEIKLLEDELGVCPLCGKSFDEHSKGDEH